MPFISYAQNFEDVMLHRALKSIKNGFYVDIGAQGPIDHSVTKAFYDLGWSGINIEPTPFYFDQLQQERPRDTNLCLAITNQTDSTGLAFYFVEQTGLSTLDATLAKQYKQQGYSVKTIKVSSRTLAEIFLQYVKQEVHFLKIDVEGAEEAVLQGMNFSLYRPWIVIVEATYPQTPRINSMKWEHFLLDEQYQCVYFDGLNQFYLASEKIALKDYFSFPPNVFDDFVLALSHDFCKQTTKRLNAVENESLSRYTQIEQLTTWLKESETHVFDISQQLEVCKKDKLLDSEQIKELTEQLKVSEQDRLLRSEQIQTLTKQLKVTEADREARAQQIKKLTEQLKISEKDRASRFTQIEKLKYLLNESELDRNNRLEAIETLQKK